MKGKWLTGALVLAMAAVTLAGCGAKDETKEKVEQVTLNEVAHSIFYAPQYVAIEEGYFADEGIDLTLITGFGADKVLTAMISGEADIGFMGAEATVYAYLEGTADPVVNFAQLTHSREFIDTIRYTLSGPHTVSMDDTVHVMNLVEGRSARIESMDGSFAPFTVHYAETAIVPAAVGTYRIVPEEGEMIKMLVASVG